MGSQSFRSCGNGSDGSDRPLVVETSSALGRASTLARRRARSRPSDDGTIVAGRNPTRRSPKRPLAALRGGVRSCRSCGCRRPCMAHGEHGFVSHVIAACARKRRVALYRRRAQPMAGGACVSTRRASSGSRSKRRRGAPNFTRVADDGVPFREIAIADRGQAQAAGRLAFQRRRPASIFGWLAMFAGLDMPASSERTRMRWGGEPSGPGCIADIDHLAPISPLRKTTDIQSCHACICHWRDRIHRLARRQGIDRARAIR